MMNVFSKKMYRFIPLVLIGVIVVSLMIVFVYLPAKGNAGWEKTIRGWGGSMDDCIQQTSDEGYITVGSINRTRAETFTGEIMNFSLIKMDENGNILWTKIYKPDNPLFEYFTGCSVQQTTEGGYVTVATVFPFSESMFPKIYLMKTDQNGSKLWESYIGEGYITGRSVQQTSDGGYVILGWAPHSEGEIYLVKTDALGKMTWQKNFGGPKALGYSLRLTSDRGYVIAGRSETVFPVGSWRIGDPAVQEDAYIVKTDANGNIVWEKKYAEKANESWNADSIQETSDGGYIVVGSMLVYGGGFGGHYLRKIDSNGNLVWEKMFSRQNSPYFFLFSVQQTSDGGYVTAGQLSAKPYLLKTDKDGNMVWDKVYGEKLLYDTEFRSVKQTSDGGYIAAGYIFYGLNESRVESDIIIVKTDENGNT